MTKKSKEELNNLGHLMGEVLELQQNEKQIKKELRLAKNRALKILESLGMDEHRVGYNDTKDIKALKYNVVKLGIKNEGKLITLLDNLGIGDSVIEENVNIKKLEEEFERGNISLNCVSRFVDFMKSECFKIQIVKKEQ